MGVIRRRERVRYRFGRLGYAAAVYMLCVSAVAHAADSGEDWKFGAAVYGWFPDISGRTGLTDSSEGSDFQIDIEDILDNLKFTFMGSFDARRGRWGVVTDVIYMSVDKKDSSVRQGSIGGIGIPVDVQADVKFEMESWIWNVAGYYRVVDAPDRAFDLLAGLRYIDIDQTLSWNLSGNVGQIPLPDRQGEAKAGLSNWDVVIGFRGRFAFGRDNAWFVPYHLDMGAGDSDFTWQAMAGVGYGFRWGEVVGFWRYLGYDLDTDPAARVGVQDADFSGPGLGMVFRW